MSDPAKLFTHPQPLASPQVPQMASIPQTPLASEQLAAGSTASWRLWLAGTAALACLFAPDVCAQDITTEVHSFIGKTILVSGEEARTKPNTQVATLPILEERKGHTPKWEKSSFEPAGEADPPPAGVFEKITYASPAGKLAAYVTPDPKDGKKHPAIIWAHGGFGGIGSFLWDDAQKKNDQSARAFRDRGIVMMCPSWRGENANPGKFELFYGELDDYLAALEHVRKLPYVDLSRIYLGGHSTGGTMVLLASVASDKFRAAFSFGGMPDCVSLMANGGYGNTPYDPASTIDNLLRSPIRYTTFIKRPTFYFEGGKSSYHQGAKKMEFLAKPLGIPFNAFELSGNHFSILHPITNLVADKILLDAGPTCNLSFTKAELESAIEASTTKGLVQLLKEWMAAGDDLGKRLDEAEDGENEIQTKEDLAAVIAAIESLTTKPVTAQVIDNLKELSTLGGNLEDEDLEDVFAKQGVPSLLAWGSEQVNSPPSAAEDQEKLVKFLVPLTWREDAKSALLVVTAAKSGLAPQSDVWKRLFSIYTEDHPRTEFVLRGVSRSLPDEKIGLAILSATNQLFLEDWEGAHPYNSQAGAALLEEWLLQETDDSSPAFQVALGLAFMDAPIRKKLLPLALDHKFRSVQLEAAWADAKHDGTRGLQVLKKACLNLTESVRAQQYLEEVGKSEEIPPTASEPKFLAKAKMTEWLQHPQELGEPPLTLEIYDQRELYWPPAKKKIIVTLLKFTYKLKEETKVGYGMVGGMSWSSFKEYDTPPTPDSLYLHHCTLEMQRGKRTEKVTDDKAARAAALKALRSGNAGKFTDQTLK